MANSLVRFASAATHFPVLFEIVNILLIHFQALPMVFQKYGACLLSGCAA